MTPVAEIALSYQIPQTKRGTERSDLVQFFREKLNQERVGTKFKQLSYPAVAWKVKHLNLSDLYYLKSAGLDYERFNGSFSKYFWGSLKVRN